jgi:hypothetical protein
MTTLGNRIKEAAEHVGGLKKLADELSVPRRTLGDWVADSSEPKVSAVASISALTGISIRWLVLGVGPKFADATDSRDISKIDADASASGTIDTDLFVAIDKAIRESYAEHGGRASAKDFAALAVTWYNDIVGSSVDLSDDREVSSWVYIKVKGLLRELEARRGGQASSSKRPAL